MSPCLTTVRREMVFPIVMLLYMDSK